jgi:hypothetical protein
MDARYKNKAIIGTSVGVSLFLGGWTVFFTFVRGAATYSTPPYATLPGSIALAMLLISVPFYLWGCACLAKAKGYSTAILLTLILGWLFPVVVLLALPDKNKHRRRWRRSAGREMSERSMTSRS